MNIEVKISKLRIPYKKAIYDLEKRVEDVKKGLKKELIWILEHPTTYTGGIRSSKNEILDKKIKIIKTNRGGKITLHNPGQKIIYFVIDLNKRKIVDFPDEKHEAIQKVYLDQKQSMEIPFEVKLHIKD